MAGGINRRLGRGGWFPASMGSLTVDDGNDVSELESYFHSEVLRNRKSAMQEAQHHQTRDDKLERLTPAMIPGAKAKIDVCRVITCSIASVVFLSLALSIWTGSKDSWDVDLAGSPWYQPSCELDALLSGQGSRLGASSDQLNSSVRVLMVHGTVSNFLSVVRGAARNGIDSTSVLVMDLFAPFTSSGKALLGFPPEYLRWKADGKYDLDGYCSEAFRRKSVAVHSLWRVGEVLDPHSVESVCSGYNTDAWQTDVDRDNRVLLLESGYGKYPHSPSFVGAAINASQEITKAPSLVISVGLPLSHETVSWVFGIAETGKSKLASVRVVFAGFATTKEIESAVSIGCDRMWTPSGASDVTASLDCALDGPSVAGKSYFILAFQSGLDPASVARACSISVFNNL